MISQGTYKTWTMKGSSTPRGMLDEGNRIQEDIPNGPDTQNLRARIGSHTGAVPRMSRVTTGEV